MKIRLTPVSFCKVLDDLVNLQSPCHVVFARFRRDPVKVLRRYESLRIGTDRQFAIAMSYCVRKVSVGFVGLIFGLSLSPRLNTHLVRVGADVASALSEADRGEPLQPRPPRVVSDSFRVRTVTLPELSHALRSMNNSKACSDDGITVDMLRRTFAVIGPHLLHVCSQ